MPVRKRIFDQCTALDIFDVKGYLGIEFDRSPQLLVRQRFVEEGFGSLHRSLGHSLVQVSVLGLQPLGASSAPALRACKTS